MKTNEEVSLVFSLVMRFNKPSGLGMSLVHQKGGQSCQTAVPPPQGKLKKNL